MLHPIVFNTAQICHQLGVRHAVMSPGSRNAPLTISFARHKEIKKWIIPDERAAGFVALGIAQETKTPVVLCCTSGTAVLNYAPAIAEAYYREIPLIILSADRPPELIDQRDGQTIRQFEALKNQVKCSYQLPVVTSDINAKDYQDELIEGILNSQALPHGPVHINIPFAEPFYPDSVDELAYQPVALQERENSFEEEVISINLKEFPKVLVLTGQMDADNELDDLLLSASEYIPVLKFPLNNLTDGIEHADLFISQQKELRPDLLITTGLSVLSKKLKLFLRNHKPKRHLHFDPSGVEVDTFQSQPQLVKGTLAHFLMNQNLKDVDTNFRSVWNSFETKAADAAREFGKAQSYSEVLVVREVHHSLPKNSNLHLSNSMPVRYADMFGVPESTLCFSNRGTSGIDGCTSTALGSALVSPKLNVLITGDLAFLYDRNAFFHNYMVPNLRVIILNNQGGGIFRLIPGPSELPELEEYFETRHNRTAEYICAESGLEYHIATDMASLSEGLSSFYSPSDTAKVLEVFTDPETNQRVFKELKNYINERINN